jgi:dUTP pyrophosphatase
MTVKIFIHNDYVYDAPKYETSGSSGIDLRACINESLILTPRQVYKIPTGLSVSLPENLEGQVRPRSGTVYKKNVTVANAPGTIDADYRGEICVLLINNGFGDVKIDPGERVAQLVFAEVRRDFAIERGEADTAQTARGAGGFGSTGER